MKRYKLGLCVCHDTKNYGSQLQVLATIRAVEMLGYDWEVIRYKKKLTPALAIRSLPRLLNRNFVTGKKKAIQKRREIARNPRISRNVQIRNRRFEQFARKYFYQKSAEYRGYKALKEGVSGYDGFLVGSDQLWLPGNLGSRFYNLLFVPDGYPKIAYATSFGVNRIPWYQRRRTACFLERFEALSVREEQGKKIIEKLTQRKVSVTADPTLLFDGKQWEKMIPPASLVQGKYMLCYFLGKGTAYRKAARRLREETGLQMVMLPFLDNFVEEDEKLADLLLYDIGAADFLNLVRNAEYILTDSLHCTVFSILYHKRFLVFDRFSQNSRESRNSRIESICRALGLEERHCPWEQEGWEDILSRMEQRTDFEKADRRLEEWRRESLTWLKNALEEVGNI